MKIKCLILAIILAILLASCPGEPEVYRVTYNGNGYTGGTVPEDSNTYEEGEVVTVLDAGSMTRTSYWFAGWNTASNGGGTYYQPGDTFTMGTEDITLYALWRDEPLLITEIMYNTIQSTETDWEWIEVYNPWDSPVDLAGWVVDDTDLSAHGSANISSGTIAAGGTAVLYSNTITSGDFETEWGTGINLVAVADWGFMPLSNTSDQIGFWDSFAAYDGDHQTHSNSVFTLSYETTVPWPESTNGVSIYLDPVIRDSSDGSNWHLSTDGTDGAYTAGSGDVGSPGVLP